jgi:hypothetical protein
VRLLMRAAVRVGLFLVRSGESACGDVYRRKPLDQTLQRGVDRLESAFAPMIDFALTRAEFSELLFEGIDRPCGRTVFCTQLDRENLCGTIRFFPGRSARLFQLESYIREATLDRTEPREARIAIVELRRELCDAALDPVEGTALDIIRRRS